MNQGKLEVVKQEKARMNTNILGISELKWTGMSEFNSDDHYIYYCGQESLRINRAALIVIGEGNGNHSSVLAWRIPGMAETGGLPSMGSHSWTQLK